MVRRWVTLVETRFVELRRNVPVKLSPLAKRTWSPPSKCSRLTRRSVRHGCNGLVPGFVSLPATALT